MRLKGSCHCGAVAIEVPARPRRLTSCNCSICRRTGGLWAYYQAPKVKITKKRGATLAYVWGDKMLALHTCNTCGCTTHWEATKKPRVSRMGVNMRLFDPADIAGVRVRRFDGADTWKFLD